MAAAGCDMPAFRATQCLLGTERMRVVGGRRDSDAGAASGGITRCDHAMSVGVAYGVIGGRLEADAEAV